MAELAIRMAVSLAVVVGLLLVMTRVAARRYRGGRSGSTVQVLQRQPLTRGSTVTVVSVGGRVLVLGTTEQQVRVLAELDPEDLDEGFDVGGDTEPAHLPTPVDYPTFERSLHAVRNDPELASALATAPAPAAPAAPAPAAPSAVSSDSLPDPAPFRAPADVLLDLTLPEPAHVAAHVPTHAAAPVAASEAAPAAPYAAMADELLAELQRLESARAQDAARAAMVATAVARGPELVDHSTAAHGGKHRAAPVPQAPVPVTVSVPAPAAPAPLAELPALELLAGLAAAQAAQTVQAAPAPAPQVSLAPAPRRGVRGAAPAADGALAGSLLSPQTWRQAFAAVSRRAS